MIRQLEGGGFLIVPCDHRFWLEPRVCIKCGEYETWNIVNCIVCNFISAKEEAPPTEASGAVGEPQQGEQ